MNARRLPWFLLPVALLAAGAFTSVAAEDATSPPPSVTVFPVQTQPEHPFPADIARRIGIVVATLLEKAGIEELAIAETPFRPPASEDVNELAEVFGQHVVAQPMDTDYAVFAQFLGTPGNGVKAIRTIVVDRQGQRLLAEEADEQILKQAQPRPQDPMTCCIFVGRRLQSLWKLQDPLRADAPEGKMAQFWKEDAGIPDPEELDAIQQRGAQFKQRRQQASCGIYPIRVGGESKPQQAAELVRLLRKQGYSHMRLIEQDPALEIAGHSNEQKVLWDTARALREFVRQHQPSTDYVLFADYGIAGGRARYVHLIVCDQQGEWVLLDLQNSHHTDFKQIDPKTAADCHRLVPKRFTAWNAE